MARAIVVGTVVLVLMLGWAALSLASFAWVFLIPAGLLVVVQALALLLPHGTPEESTFKTRLFLAGDFAYYIVLGAVVTMLGSYLPALESILSHEARVTYEAAVETEPELRADHAEASAAYRDSSRSLDGSDPQILGECMIRFQTERFDADTDDEAIALMPYPRGCEIPLSVADVATRDAGAFLSTGRDLEAAERVIAEGPEPPSIQSRLPAEDTLFLLLYKVFPSLLLCGVVLKLGKTTAAILK